MSIRANLPNPFRQRAVTDLWQPLEHDLPSLHRDPFSRCCEALAKLRAEAQVKSLLLRGEAGGGKSHLLARLCAHLQQTNASNDFSVAEGATFIAVNLQKAPVCTWRYLQVCLATDLLRSTPSGLTQLERLLLSRLTHYGLVEGDGLRWLQQVRADARGATAFFNYLDDVFDAIDRERLIGPDLRKVLRYLMLNFHPREASAWLRGEPLQNPILEHMGLSHRPTQDVELEEQARRIVLALSLLVTPQLPFVFCFDQIEAVQSNQGLEVFLNIYQALRAELRVALFIVGAPPELRAQLRQPLRELETMRQGELVEVSLEPLAWREAQQLMQSRLDLLPALAQQRQRYHDRFWPLDESDLLLAIGHPVRQLLAHCSSLFEQQRPIPTGELRLRKSTSTSGALLARGWQERYQKALNGMADDSFDERLTQGLSALARLLRPGWRLRTDELPRDVDLLFEGPQYNVHITLSNQSHLPSFTKKLQRINERFYGHRTYKLFLLRDSRRTFGPMSRSPRKMRDALVERGAIWLDVTPETQAALETLHVLYLKTEGNELERQKMSAWLSTNPPGEVKQLLDQIFPEEITEKAREGQKSLAKT